MNRRSFISSLAGVSSGPQSDSAEKKASRNLIRSSKGLEPITLAEWNSKTAAHLLRRTMFGPTRAEIQQASSQTLDATLTTLFSAQPLPDPPINSTGQGWTSSVFDSTNDGSYALYLKAWWHGLMVKQGMSVREKMVLFCTIIFF